MNEDTTYKNLGHVVKAVLTVKCVATNAYIKKEERSQIFKLTFPPKILEKKNKTNLKQVEANKY